MLEWEFSHLLEQVCPGPSVERRCVRANPGEHQLVPVDSRELQAEDPSSSGRSPEACADDTVSLCNVPGRDGGSKLGR